MMTTEYTCPKCGVIKGLPKLKRISPVDILYKCNTCDRNVTSYTINASDINRMPDDVAGHILSEMYC
jgi:DNA-directed RNA polymerase subunit RPC12/RpoP